MKPSTAAPFTPALESVADIARPTPLIPLRRVLPRNGARIYLKLESMNLAGSVKDRVGRAMVLEAERAGVLEPGRPIVEPTSGNTGIALAFIAAARGYPLTLTMPENMSEERGQLLRGLGATLITTPWRHGMSGAIDKAEEIQRETGAWMPRQFENPANPAAHEATTGPEIWADSRGSVDLFVAGVGTGGTITGVGRYLRRMKSEIEVIAVEPHESFVLSGCPAGEHRIPGIGAGFVPPNLDRSLLDGVERVTSGEAIQWARRLAREEGILAGISGGANVAAAVRLSQRTEYRDATIVTVVASSGERYLSQGIYAFQSSESPGLLQMAAHALGLHYHI